MKKLFFASIILGTSAFGLNAQEAPEWMQSVLPQSVLDSSLESYQATYADGALDGKTKHLIALSTSAQIPCEYCIIGHTQAARGAGATDDEIKEALAAGAEVRYFSTMLNGSQYDMGSFRTEMGLETEAAAN